jgi:hypothetical protein
MELFYQTASVYKQTWHIGKLKARCVSENRCTPTELKALQRFNPGKENKREMAKKVPARFPSNEDSIGIELVGEALPRGSNVAPYLALAPGWGVILAPEYEDVWFDEGFLQ